MTRISRIAAGGIADQPKPPASRPASGFNVESAGDPPAVQANQPAQTVLLSGMLALQETETETVQDKAARRHGIALLDTLSKLQKALLSLKEDNGTEIEALALLANDMPQAAHPALAAALADIRLRAKIELLRRGIEIT